MADRSRTQAWLRDELILALDLYVREGPSADQETRQEVSGVLRAIPIEPHLADNPQFRSTQAIAYKLHNFVHIDPAQTTEGFPHGAKGDQDVWDEFASDPERLAAAAAAIRANILAVTQTEAENDEDDVADAPEGQLLTRVHRVRERNRKLVERKKKAALDSSGELQCEACTFNFSTVYGERGDGFIECHHTVPLHEPKTGTRTRLTDLALVCSNCHRMLHRRSPWLTMEQLRALLARRPPIASLSA